MNLNNSLLKIHEHLVDVQMENNVARRYYRLDAKLNPKLYS